MALSVIVCRNQARGPDVGDVLLRSVFKTRSFAGEAGRSGRAGRGLASRHMSLEVVNMSAPQRVSTFPYGRFELFVVGGQEIGRAVYEPGWRWSEHIGPTAGAQLCEVEHLGLVISGHAAVKMTDGTEIVLGPGDFFSIPAGHDSWVVGEEDYVSLHLLGAGQYSTTAGRTTSPD